MSEQTNSAESYPIPLRLTSGEAAQVLQSDGDKTTILSPLPAPPGATVQGSIEGVTAAFQMKVRNCSKTEDGFKIDGRLRNAPRELKKRLIG